MIQASMINQIDDNYLNWALLSIFTKDSFQISKVRSWSVICSQILNRTLTMCSDKTLNY